MCDLCYVDAQTSGFVGLGINVFPAYVYIIFVYRVVYVDMSTRSSQLNYLSLESRVLSGPSRLDHNLYRFSVRNELIVIIKPYTD